MHEHLSGNLSAGDAVKLKDHLAACSDCSVKYTELEKIYQLTAELPELDPPVTPGIKSGYSAQDHNLLSAGTRAGSRIHVRRTVYAAAGIAAAVIMFFAGFLTGRNQAAVKLENEQIAALQAEVRETKNLMIVNMLQQESASKRLMAVNYAENLDLLLPETVDALLNSLSNDRNVNVRLATLGTLSRFSYDEKIRTELLKAFDRESEPLLQLNMINLMVLLNEKSSAEILQKLVADEHTSEMVREQARKGLNVLL